MKRESIFNRLRGIALVLLASLFLFGGTPSLYAKGGVSYYSDDMYGVHSQEKITQQKVAEEYAQQAMEELRMAQWADLLGIEVDQLARQGEEYNTAFGEKLRALANEEYQLPDSYYEYSYQSALEELAQYDPELYNASISSTGELSIEPKYISSIYGVWGDPYYDYSWFYGYPAYGYAPYAYYSMWGYPYSNWWFGARFGFNYNYYNPWWGGYYGWGGGFGWGWGPGWGFGYSGYGGWYQPHHHAPNNRPNGPSGGGSSSAGRNIVRRASSTQSPSSSSSTRSSATRNSDGSTVGRSSGSSNGNSSGSYNRSATSTYKAPSYNNNSNSSTRTRSISTPSSSPSRVTSSPSRTNSIGR